MAIENKTCKRLKKILCLFMGFKVVKLREADFKLKEVKCNFLKKHIQYLGHMVSGKGITPVPEKLESIQKMPPPKTPKEVKQFVGLIGYYHKFLCGYSL